MKIVNTMDDDEYEKNKFQSKDSRDKFEMVDLDEKDESKDFDQ